MNKFVCILAFLSIFVLASSQPIWDTNSDKFVLNPEDSTVVDRLDEPMIEEIDAVDQGLDEESVESGEYIIVDHTEFSIIDYLSEAAEWSLSEENGEEAEYIVVPNEGSSIMEYESEAAELVLTNEENAESSEFEESINSETLSLIILNPEEFTITDISDGSDAQNSGEGNEEFIVETVESDGGVVNLVVNSDEIFNIDCTDGDGSDSGEETDIDIVDDEEFIFEDTQRTPSINPLDTEEQSITDYTDDSGSDTDDQTDDDTSKYVKEDANIPETNIPETIIPETIIESRGADITDVESDGTDTGDIDGGDDLDDLDN